jgi:hypothetical protein
VPGFEELDYDYMASRSKLVSAKDWTRSKFKEQISDKSIAPGSIDSARAQNLLLFEDGFFNRLEVGKRLQLRDDKRVQIAE